MEPGGRGALGKAKAKGRVADTMSRAKVAICALVAVFMFGALAATALAKKEYKREFTASGPEVKLETAPAGTSAYQFTLPFEEKGKGFEPYKIKCTEVVKATGEIHGTEGVAQSFTDKVTLGGCSKGKGKFFKTVTVSAIEFEFHANGTFSIVNEAETGTGRRLHDHPRRRPGCGRRRGRRRQKGTGDLRPDRPVGAGRHPQGRSQNQDADPRRRRSRRARI